MARRSSGFFGGSGGGLLFLVVGLVVKHAEANEVSACSSGLGRFGQVLDPGVASSCASAQDLSSMASVLTWIGAIVLVLSVGGFLLSLIGAGAAAAAGKKASAAAPRGTAEARPRLPTPPPATGNAQPGPALSQESGPPTQPRRLACGHEWRPGTRFCPVCGRPVADASSVSVAAQPEPTAVVPSPAMTDRWTGRSFDAPASVPYQERPGPAVPYQERPGPAVKPGRHRVSR